MSNANEHDHLKAIYEDIALSRDERTTACDFNLRELEIQTALEYMSDGLRVLDVGCGLGYAVRQFASKKNVDTLGVDYADNMVAGAHELTAKKETPLIGRVDYRQADVTKLPLPDSHFDVVSSSRCLMALLDWERQKQALVEIARVLKPNGFLVLMEGTFEGLERLNDVRQRFGLPAIDAGGKDRLCTLKFHEADLVQFCLDYYTLERIQRFGMYYFLTRVVHPLLVAPESPKYDARINSIALDIARKIPDYQGLGHLAAFIFRKKG